jgi:hypothetical protein
VSCTLSVGGRACMFSLKPHPPHPLALPRHLVLPPPSQITTAALDFVLTVLVLFAIVAPWARVVVAEDAQKTIILTISLQYGRLCTTLNDPPAPGGPPTTSCDTYVNNKISEGLVAMGWTVVATVLQLSVVLTLMGRLRSIARGLGHAAAESMAVNIPAVDGSGWANLCLAAGSFGGATDYILKDQGVGDTSFEWKWTLGFYAGALVVAVSLIAAVVGLALDIIGQGIPRLGRRKGCWCCPIAFYLAES